MSILYNLKLVYRNFINQRPYSFLNLIGLSIGLSVAFIALLCVTEHTGYDTHHKNSKHIYRLLSQTALHGEEMSVYEKIGTLKMLKNQIPEIVNLFDYYPSNFDVEQENKLNKKNKTFKRNFHSGEIYASPEIINILTFNIVDGDFESFKTEPKTIIISERYALKYFNSVFVAGKSFSFKKQGTFTIGAVFKNFPKKSSFDPELIVPIQNLKPKPSLKLLKNREELSVYNYFLLEKNANPEAVIKKINQVVKPLLKKDEEVKYKFQALEKVHLNSEGIINSYSAMSTKKLTVYIVIGCLVLLISLANFLLLYNAIAKRRLKELMVRKVNGLSVFGLFKMFLIESIIISIVASIMALVITHFLIPIFNDITSNTLKLNLRENYAFLVSIVALVALVSLLSSGYLYMRIKKYSTINIFRKHNKNKIFNNSTVILQLIIISVMIIFSMGYYKQLHFMIHADKGYKTDDITVLDSEFNTPTIRQELLRHPLILSVASGYALPSTRMEAHTMSKHWDDPEKFKVNANYIDANYLSMYQFQLKEGENFTKNSRQNEIIINETAVKKLGLKKPIGEEISDGTIIGVVKDYNISRFSEAIIPVSLSYNSSGSKELSIKYLKGSKDKALIAIKGVLDKEFPDNTFDLKAYGNSLDKQYYTEKTMLKVVLVLTLSAIFITILGLVGMSLFKTQQKTKELGIRKVNGATIKEIMLMLNKDFIKWVVIAFVIACPIAYYAMSKWLENFAYKTPLSWWVFALAGVFTLVIALVTVSWQSYRAATRNPVESLRDE